MTPTHWRAALRRTLHAQWQQLAAFQATRRRWSMPVAAALASGLPLLAGAALGHIGAGLGGSLGGLVFLHLPETPMHHRMATLGCALGLIAGVVVHSPRMLKALERPLQALTPRRLRR